MPSLGSIGYFTSSAPPALPKRDGQRWLIGDPAAALSRYDKASKNKKKKWTASPDNILIRSVASGI